MKQLMILVVFLIVSSEEYLANTSKDVDVFEIAASLRSEEEEVVEKSPDRVSLSASRRPCFVTARRHLARSLEEILLDETDVSNFACKGETFTNTFKSQSMFSLVSSAEDQTIKSLN
ncbi:hypothetical protein C0J52_00287 [Blattella germanica]|nr:hypothetical protein C0J52_00287 [Blattella germanica]